MYYKDYTEPYEKLLEINIIEAFVDVAVLDKSSDKYANKYRFSDIVTMFSYDFDDIMKRIPLNEEGIFVGLAYHYHVSSAWEISSPIPWEVDNIKLCFSQLVLVKDILTDEIKNLNSDDHCCKLYQICKDMCLLFEKAINSNQKVYIKYYYP